MDPVALLCLIYKIGKELKGLAKEVEANKNACGSLLNRVSSILDSISQLTSQERSTPDPNYQRALQRLLDVLQEINNFLPKFKRPTEVSMIEIVSWYAHLANDRGDDHAKFDKFNRDLTQSAQDLQLGLIVVQQFSSRRDFDDITDDIELLRSDLLDFLDVHRSEMDNSASQRFDKILSELISTVSYSFYFEDISLLLLSLR